MPMPDEDFNPSDPFSYEAYEDSLEVKCGKVSISPIGDNKEKKTAKKVEPTPVPPKASDSNINQEAKESADFLKGIQKYIGSNEFQKQINDTAKKTKIPPEAIKKNFFRRLAGTIADTMNIGINMLETGVDVVFDLINAVLKGGASLICTVARAIVRTLTFNSSNRVTN